MMRDTILVPLDGSAIAEEGLISACRLARQTGAVLWLMRAVSFGALDLDVERGEGRRVQEAMAYLQAVREDLARQGFTAQIEVLPCEPVRAILFACKAHNVGLISICTHGVTGLRHVLVGSVAEAVISRQPAPILLTRAGHHSFEKALALFQRLLVPVDGTPSAEAALAYLSKEQLARNGEVILLQAVPPFQPIAVPMLTGDAMTAILEQADQETTRHQAEADAYLTTTGNAYLSGSTWKSRSVVGYPSQEIPAVATAERADLIVMATHGRHGLDKLVYGSVAEEVVRRAEMPVLLVPSTTAGLAKRSLQSRQGVGASAVS